jgi:hypothetical protein
MENTLTRLLKAIVAFNKSFAAFLEKNDPPEAERKDWHLYNNSWHKMDQRMQIRFENGSQYKTFSVDTKELNDLDLLRFKIYVDDAVHKKGFSTSERNIRLPEGVYERLFSGDEDAFNVFAEHTAYRVEQLEGGKEVLEILGAERFAEIVVNKFYGRDFKIFVKKATESMSETISDTLDDFKNTDGKVKADNRDFEIFVKRVTASMSDIISDTLKYIQNTDIRFEESGYSKAFWRRQSAASVEKGTGLDAKAAIKELEELLPTLNMPIEAKFRQRLEQAMQLSEVTPFAQRLLDAIESGHHEGTQGRISRAIVKAIEPHLSQYPNLAAAFREAGPKKTI